MQNQLFDSRLSVAKRTQNFPRMLADPRRHSGFLLRGALHVERAADGRNGAELRMIELRENAVGQHLWISGHLLHRRNRPPDHTLLAEDRVPFGHISGADRFIKQPHYLFAMSRTGLGRGVTRVSDQLRSSDRTTDSPPVIDRVEQAEHEAPRVACLVLIDQRIERGGARAPDRESRADHGGLNLATVAPGAGRHQRSRYLGPPPCHLALIEREHDRAEQSERYRMIA